MEQPAQHLLASSDSAAESVAASSCSEMRGRRVWEFLDSQERLAPLCATWVDSWMLSPS